MHLRADFRGFLQYVHLVQHFFTALSSFDGFFPVKGFQFLDNLFLMFDFPLLIQPGMHAGFPKL